MLELGLQHVLFAGPYRVKCTLVPRECKLNEIKINCSITEQGAALLRHKGEWKYSTSVHTLYITLKCGQRVPSSLWPDSNSDYSVINTLSTECVTTYLYLLLE
jgi:hypothetical protein